MMKNWRKKEFWFIVSNILIFIFCLLPWAKIPSQQTILYGLDMSGTNFGRPAILTLSFCMGSLGIYIFFGKSYWGRMASIFSSALLLAWHLRNWSLLSVCDFGECLEIFAFFHIMTIFTLLHFYLLISFNKKNK